MKNNKGITLIALIITIIVMLILVAVTINMAVNGGLFGYAGNAAKDTKTEKQKEEDWTNPGENLSSDDLIEFYTSQPKDWVIGWVYKNGAWSNPYFKDKNLENNFTFRETYGGNDYEDIDPSYSISSESELTGQIVVKLYNNGELNIQGSGDIPYLEKGGYADYYTGAPWQGGYHYIGSYQNEEYTGYGYHIYNLKDYLQENITSLVIGEGITSLPGGAFYEINIETVRFPSTISSIAKTAFEQTPWILNILDEVGEEAMFPSSYSPYGEGGVGYWCINVEINGTPYPLALFVND